MKVFCETEMNKSIYSTPRSSVYTQVNNYNSEGTHILGIEAGTYRFTVIGGGGGSAQVDGGTDEYTDTVWAHHYGHNGAAGGVFEGYLQLPKGTLSILTGAVGINLAGKGNTAGNGGDSYVIFVPEGSSTGTEIVRAGGGHSGYPEGNSFMAPTPGGTVTYDSNYVTEVIKAQPGADGLSTWVVFI